MEIRKVYHIELTQDDWNDLKACGIIHFSLDGILCDLKQGMMIT